MGEFDNIWPGLIGGDRARKLLCASIAHDHLLHNNLLEGPLGVGKLPFAIAFARSIICSNPDSVFACGECDDCRLFDHGRHPDALVMSRESELNANEARKIANMVMLTPQRKDRKIIVLDGIDRINLFAGNALLKTLEEAPGGSIFILTTHRPEKLLPTILSRSLRVPFFLLPAARLADDYKRVLDVDDSVARQASELSGGRPGWGIRFLMHPEFRELYKYGKEIVENALLKLPLGRIFHKEGLIENFLSESARIFSEQNKISGMDGCMIARVLNGEEVDFHPVNLFRDESTTQKRHLDALGFVLLGGIFRGMVAAGEVQGELPRYHRLMEAFLEAPKQLERYFNRDLVIERFILSAHGRYGV